MTRRWLIKPNSRPGWRRPRAFAALLLLFFCPFAVQAHIGSPNVFFEGPAGPYPVRVTIEPPGVVPGLAQIHIRVHSGRPQTVTVLPVRWNLGTKGAPSPDAAQPVPGETNLFTGQLWFMDSGAYSVFVDVSGPEGHGTAVVPLDSLAFQRFGMSRGMAVLFACLGLFLVVLLMFIVGAAVRESTLPLGDVPTVWRRHLALLAMLFTGLIAITALVFGNKWWDFVDQKFLTRTLYTPPPMTPTLETGADGAQDLIVRIDSTRRFDASSLVPDHGAIMHLFLIHQPKGDAFAHLHPVRDTQLQGTSFRTRLPALPAGEYQLFADITHESGLSQTLTNVLDLPAVAAGSPPARELASPDDAFDLESPHPPAPAALDGGFRLNPDFDATFRANQETTLKFDLTTDAGAPAPLEPYLGMYGHLLIQHADGTVFTHLHPLGSISMVSQRRFAEREHAAYLANQPLDLLCAPPSRTLAFPYAFPKPGSYRLWLQAKLQGRILTFPFSVNVE
jgi:hypothetical protein